MTDTERMKFIVDMVDKHGECHIEKNSDGRVTAYVHAKPSAYGRLYENNVRIAIDKLKIRRDEQAIIKVARKLAGDF